MRIFMQTKPAANEAPKFCNLLLQQDLLGGWTLIRETGQPGQRGSLKREFYESQADAQAALERVRDQQLKRGFQVMFRQGQGAPMGMSDD